MAIAVSDCFWLWLFLTVAVFGCCCFWLRLLLVVSAAISILFWGGASSYFGIYPLVDMELHVCLASAVVDLRVVLPGVHLISHVSCEGAFVGVVVG